MPYTNWNASQAGNVHTPVFENLAIGHKVRVHQNDTSRFYGVRGSVASIGVRLVAGANVNAINATLGTLTKSQGGDSIGPSAHEIRTIKVWWGHEAQWWTNSRVGGTFNDILIPGPLLFNDALIGVDRDARTNTVGGEVKTTKSVPGSYSKPTHGAFTVTESASLQNFNLAAGEEKCLLVETRIPGNQAAGVYTGTLNITIDGVNTVALPIRLRVLPFDFVVKPDRIAGIYFEQLVDLDLTNDDTPVGATGERISLGHLQAALNEAGRSGINPTCYEAPGTAGSVQRARFEAYLQARNAAGMQGWPLYSLGLTTVGYSHDATGRSQIAAAVAAMKAITDAYGCGDLYIYGADENDTELVNDEPVFRGVQDAGGKTFVAMNQNSYSLMSSLDYLNMPVISGYPEASQVNLWHAAGCTPAKYGTPQSGPQSPAVMRLSMGLRPWSRGFNGPFTWSMSRAYNDVWNPFDHATYNEEIMMFPVANPGVIPTLAWRGYREAVYDLRYIDTLEAAIAASPAGAAKTNAQAYLDGLKTTISAVFSSTTASVYDFDLDLVRDAVVGYIETLQ